MVVGLTGAIASGKSLVSAEFARLGAFVIDADLIARQIVEPGSPAYNEIVAEFGEEFVGRDGNLARKALGRLVFSDRERLAALNRIITESSRRADRDVALRGCESCERENL